MYQLEKRAEREIDLIENDESMTQREKRIAIKEIYDELRDAEREREIFDDPTW